MKYYVVNTYAHKINEVNSDRFPGNNSFLTCVNTLDEAKQVLVTSINKEIDVLNTMIKHINKIEEGYYNDYYKR